MVFRALGSLALYVRFQYALVDWTSPNVLEKYAVLAFRSSNVTLFLAFLYADHFLGHLVETASLNSLYLRFILSRISLVIQGAEILLIFTFFHGACLSHKSLKRYCQTHKLSSGSSNMDAIWNGALSMSSLELLISILL